MASARRRRSRRGARSQMLPCRELRRAPDIYLGRAASTRGTLLREKFTLAVDAPLVTAQLTGLPYHAIAGDDDRYPVVGDSAGDGAHCFRRSNGIGNVAVRTSLAERNLLQLVPDFPLECRSLNVERYVKPCSGT